MIIKCKICGDDFYIRPSDFKAEKYKCCSKKTNQLDLANISQEYKREISDWEWLCRKCHMTKDGRLKCFLKNRYIPEKRGKLIKCHICDKEKYFIPSVIKKYNFCSIKCLGIFNRKIVNKIKHDQNLCADKLKFRL